jgi:hypothetical protein
VSDVAYGFAALDAAAIDPVGFIAQATTRDITGVRIGVGDRFLWRNCDPGIAEIVQEGDGVAKTSTERSRIHRANLSKAEKAKRRAQRRHAYAEKNQDARSPANRQSRARPC